MDLIDAKIGLVSRIWAPPYFPTLLQQATIRLPTTFYPPTLLERLRFRSLGVLRAG